MNRTQALRLLIILAIMIASMSCARLHLAKQEVAEKERALTPKPNECLIYVIREGKFYAGAVNYGVFINKTFCLLNNNSFSAVISMSGEIDVQASQVDDLLYRDVLTNNASFTDQINMPFYEVPYYYEIPIYGLTLKTLEFSIIKSGIKKSKEIADEFRKGLDGFTPYRGKLYYQNINYVPSTDTSAAAVMRLIKNPPELLFYFPGVVPKYGGSYNARGAFSFPTEAGKVYFLTIKPALNEIKIRLIPEQEGRNLINKLPATPYKMKSNSDFWGDLYDLPED